MAGDSLDDANDVDKVAEYQPRVDSVARRDDARYPRLADHNPSHPRTFVARLKYGSTNKHVQQEFIGRLRVYL
eukprot:154465-Pyramimonas_sp.AAC.1